MTADASSLDCELRVSVSAMDISDQDLAAMATHLQNTLNQDVEVRTKAQLALSLSQSQPGYPQVLLRLLVKEGVPEAVVQAAAITFKNFVKEHWYLPSNRSKKLKSCGTFATVHEPDKAFIRANILDLVLMNQLNAQNQGETREGVRRQLLEAVNCISKSDFPRDWKELLPSLIEKFGTGDFEIINGALEIAQLLFMRYRHQDGKAPLGLQCEELKEVLGAFAEPLTKLFQSTVTFIRLNANHERNLKMGMSGAILIAKLFLSLSASSKAIPHIFQEHMVEWMSNFLALFTFEDSFLQGLEGHDAQPGPSDNFRTQVCKISALYVDKYDAHFKQYLPEFMDKIWYLLTHIGNQSKYDLLVCVAIDFLVKIAERAEYSHLFAAEGAIPTICEKVILPNMEFRPVDRELFEDNPEEFMRRDIEGLDTHTRRRAAADLVRALCQNFERQVYQVCGGYIEELLRKYALSPETEWSKKDAAIYLLTSLGSRVLSVDPEDTQTSQLIPIEEFYLSHILPELISQGPIEDKPVLKAGALRYLVTFRNRLDKVYLVQAMFQCKQLLKSPSPVVQSYAGLAIERILQAKDKQNPGSPKVELEDCQQFMPEVLKNIFDILASERNGYLERCLNQCVNRLQSSKIQGRESLLGSLAGQMAQVSIG